MGAKKKRSSGTAKNDTPLTLSYRLVDLPTSQHRAGLVGLVMLVRYLHMLGETQPDDAEVVSIDPGGASLRFTAAGMAALFDCAHSASIGEVSVDKPYKKGKGEVVPPLRTETEDVVGKRGKTATRTKYIYQKTIPRGAFLETRDPSGDSGVWIKLWRDMLWSIPRGKPTTRAVFDARARGELTTDAERTYERLKRRPDGQAKLTSTFLLGAQDRSADNVTFRDAASSQLLLHFWPFATELFVPRTVGRDGAEFGKGEYVFVFPDVADMYSYCDAYFDFLLARSPERRGYLPRQAVIDLPGEGGLRTMSWLVSALERRTQRAGAESLDDLVLGVDVVHARKDDKEVRIVSRARVEPSEEMSSEYQRLTKRDLWSHVFRKQLLVNLLSLRPWYTDFGRILSTLPTTITFDDSPFQHDARVMLVEEKPMTDEQLSLPALVYRVARNYLTGMLRSKYDLTWSEETKENSRDYNEKKEKLAREALLAMRSRTESDFIEYVTTTVFSVAQGMSKENYVTVSQTLLEEPEKFRTLLMLAFSAQMPRPQKTDSTQEKKG